MKTKVVLLLLCSVSLIMLMAFHPGKPVKDDDMTGAWLIRQGNEEQVILIADGYYTHTTYDKIGKRFIQTNGGTYTLDNNLLTVKFEFSTKDPEKIGQATVYPVSFQNGLLMAVINGRQEGWQRLDQGNTGLHGLWKITARQGEGGLVPIHQTGTRKTVKILTGTRFQWAAIDPGTKQFMGTGGGTYTFNNGKYTEQIEFFSRDSSRVGSALSFEGKLENGEWHHSGVSSRGEPIYEVWSRNK